MPVPAPGGTGRVIVVWGPAGAPGRTTLAAGIAGELARRERRTILVDADPYGGTVAQQLGIMDEVSGLLSAARLATSGALEARFDVGAAWRRQLAVGGHRPAPARPLRGGAVGHRRAPPRGGPQPGHRGGRHRLQPGGRARPRLRRPPRSQPAHAGRHRGGRRAGRGRLGRPDGAVATGASARRRTRADGRRARPAWWSTGCARPSAGRRRTSPAWSPASPASRACTSSRRTGSRSTGPSCPAGCWSRPASPR